MNPEYTGFIQKTENYKDTVNEIQSEYPLYSNNIKI